MKLILYTSNNQSEITMKRLLLTVLTLAWIAVLQAQTVINIPFRQYPRLKVVAPTVSINLDNGADLLGSDLVVEGGDGQYAYLWTDTNGNELGRERTLRVQRAGDYYLRVSDGQQCQVTAKFTVTGTSGIEALAQRGLTVTMNGSLLTMTYPSAPLQVRIVNAAGQLERKLTRLPADSFTEDLSALPTGFYMVCIAFPDGQAIVMKLEK